MNDLEIPEILDCDGFHPHSEMNCETYNELYCVGCANCKTHFKDSGRGTTYKCEKGHPIAWVHVWEASSKYGAVKTKSLAYRSVWKEEE